MLKRKFALATGLWLITTLVHIPLISWADELGAQGVDFDGRPVGVTTTFSGGFLTEEGFFRGDGNVNATSPVNITGQINVDPSHIGQLADLVVYVYYSTLEDPTSILLMLADGGTVMPWNSDITSLIPFVKQVQLQATHSLEIYNGPLPESKIQVYFGYLLADGTLVTNKLPIEIIVEASPEAVNTEAESEEDSAAQIDTTPLLTEGGEDGKLVGKYACKWDNGQTLKVAVDFSDADYPKYKPSPCYSGMARSACENAVADAVIRTASTWSQYGNIYFRKTAWNDADIRITFREIGSHSYVGKCKPATGYTMNLAFSFLSYAEGFKRTVLHEFGHAIGLEHEHISPNVAYQWNEQQIIAEMSGPPNNWSEQTIRSNIIDSLLKGNSRSAFFVTQFDPQSIMIYSIPKSWVSPSDLADPRNCPDASSRYYCVGPKNDLSALDKQGIAGFYPQRSRGSGCSYTYDPSSYRPGTASWDGHIGQIAFYNPTSAAVKVTLYHPDAPGWAFGAWNIPARVNGWLYYKNSLLTVGMDWGIQVNNSPICILKVASDWKANYFQTSTTRLPGM